MPAVSFQARLWPASVPAAFAPSGVCIGFNPSLPPGRARTHSLARPATTARTEAGRLYPLGSRSRRPFRAFCWAVLQAVGLALPPASAADAGRLDITFFGNDARLTWTNNASVLEQALDVTGPWSEVVGVTSGFTTPATNITRFFRLRQVAPMPPNRYAPPEFNVSIGDPVASGCSCTSPENPNGGTPLAGSAQDNAMGNVFLHTGELVQRAVDLSISGRGFDWRFERTYRSGMNYDGPLGYGWDFNYNWRPLFIGGPVRAASRAPPSRRSWSPS